MATTYVPILPGVVPDLQTAFTPQIQIPISVGDEHYMLCFGTSFPDGDGTTFAEHWREKREIFIATDVTESFLMELLIHELLHATIRGMPEDEVRRAAHEIANVLTGLGYRPTMKWH